MDELVAADTGSDQTVEDFTGYALAKLGIRFDQPSDVRQILLTLGSSTGFIEKGPELSLQHILNGRYLQRDAEDVPCLGARYKSCVAGISLDLHAKKL
jgi:hypothetical protein